ncbi:MAG: hypothetical protein ACHQ51_11735 [Elusimicrobiota bacterium]
MKDKLLLLVCAVSVLSSAAALAASLAVRARAAEIDPQAAANMSLVAQNIDTNVYLIHAQGTTCFVASARGGSGISIQCEKSK